MTLTRRFDVNRYQLTSDKASVLDTLTGAIISVSGTWQSDAYQAWLDEGNIPDSVPSLSFDDYVAQFTPGLQAWMEEVARSNNYDSVLSCVSYKDDEVSQFAGDAASMIAWRSALWRWASQWQMGFNGDLPDVVPTIDDVIKLAPQPEQFGWVTHPKGHVIESHAPAEQSA